MHAVTALWRAQAECQSALCTPSLCLDMVKALQNNAIEEWKRASYYRSVDALLIDDIRFANKERSQEEFSHSTPCSGR